MKTFLHLKKTVKAIAFSVSLLTLGYPGNSQQTSNELIFQNNSLYSGTAGNDGAVYRFPSINSDLDALVKITGRSSVLVTLTNIDLAGQGFAKAFQPQIKYNDGNVTGAITWWMEFEITFVNKNTTTPAIVNNFNVTGIDIDGDDDKLKEWQAYYSYNSYTLESNTQLVSTGITGTIALPALAGKKFTGTITGYPGIDTIATEIMTTLAYSNMSKITLRMGGTTTGSVSNVNRMYSAWFKNFTFNGPITTLPVKLVSFNAMLNNNKVDLKWTTASEINVSHFVIEKSNDGINYSDAGVVFAYGNTTDKTNYNFSDNVNTAQSAVIYYRLRSVDIDGKSQYSETRIIRIGKQSENNITILTYPNPVSNELRITIPANWQNKKVTYELFNGNGQSSKKTETANSSQTETLNVNSLAPGFYIVRVSCDGKAAQQKVVKQ